MSLRVTINKGVYEQGRQVMRNGLDRMLTGIHKDAVTNAPIGKAPEDKHPGRLKDSGRFKLQDMKGYVAFGGGSVPYAKRREYENHRHPGTRFYLHRAVAKAQAHADNYFQRILK
jgi:hypothetical protein